MLERIGGGQRLGFHALPLVIRVGQPESFYRRLPGLTLSDFLLILLVGALLLPPLTLGRLGVPALPLLLAHETLGRGVFALDGRDEKTRRILRHFSVLLRHEPVKDFKLRLNPVCWMCADGLPGRARRDAPFD